MEKITLSIVSHGHGNLVIEFAKKLATTSIDRAIRLIITVNSPKLDNIEKELIPINSRTEIVFIRNSVPLGFGENHNRAFKHCNSNFFCIVNPDIDLISDPFPILIGAFTDPKVGLVYPSQIDGKSEALDFERVLVTPTSILRRHVLRQQQWIHEYQSIDWVNGAFMMFSSAVYKELGGFDERYYMYCEDVDICLRLQLAGYKLKLANVKVIHNTQRKTLKNIAHLSWHFRSLFRLWFSTSYKAYKNKLLSMNHTK
jgi:N-acetylglucosaminyl-diphospho-decaprenol L-rhamnosyltransferase